MGARQRGQQGVLLGRPVVDIHHVVQGRLEHHKLAKENWRERGESETKEVKERYSTAACAINTINNYSLPMFIAIVKMTELDLNCGSLRFNWKLYLLCETLLKPNIGPKL